MQSLKVQRNKNLDTLRKTQTPFQVNLDRMLFSRMNSMIAMIQKNSTKFRSVLPQQTSSSPTTSQCKKLLFLTRLNNNKSNGNFPNQKVQTKKITSFHPNPIKPKTLFKSVTSSQKKKSKSGPSNNNQSFRKNPINLNSTPTTSSPCSRLSNSNQKVSQEI